MTHPATETGPAGGPPRRQLDGDRAATALLAVAGAMSLAYGAELAVDVLRPRPDETEPAIGLFSPLWPDLPRVVFWCVVASWVAAPTVWLVARLARRMAPDTPALRPSRYRLLVAVVLLLPFSVHPVVLMAEHVPALLRCVPTTAFALWAVHRMPRHRRMPGWLLLAAAGWGALVATGFAGALNLWFMNHGVAYLGDPADLMPADTVTTGAFLHGAIVEELGKAAGVWLAFVLARRHVHGVVSGVVLGAAVGLGFNLTESVEYVSASGATGEFQYWMRQFVGLMAAHTAFTAVVGAGIGLARGTPNRARRWIIVGAGLFASAGGHFANNTIFAWYSTVRREWFTPGGPLDVLVVTPAVLVALQGPFVALYLATLWIARRAAAQGLAVELDRESRTGLPAVTPVEVPVLLDPATRLWMRVRTVRELGFAAYRQVRRVQAAQLELALGRLRVAHGDPDATVDVDVLRNRVLRLKQAWSDRSTVVRR